MNMIGRLKIMNHGTENEPRYLAIGVFSQLPFDNSELKIDMYKDGVLINIKEILGEHLIVVAGTPADPMYGHDIKDVMLNTNAFLTSQEAGRLSISEMKGYESWR